jgi:PKD repeat protein
MTYQERMRLKALYLTVAILLLAVLVPAAQASAPVADFSGTPLYGANYVTVQFTDLSSNTPSSWLWDFGDGDTTNNTHQHPVHTFLGAGSYTVSLTATNSDGFDTETKANYITVIGASTRIRVIKYAADGTTILAETTVTNKSMEENLPRIGDGITHYYHQGPVYLDDPNPVVEEMLRWNPKENTNYLEKDYNAVKGTNLKNICNLVGPIPEGSRIRVRATDGFTKWFAYRNVYQYSSRDGPMVVTWWRPDEKYVPYYTTGMRLIWFADTSVNPMHVHAFGNWDWHEAANPNYWYYNVEGAEQYPTTTGLSVQKVSEIAIFTGITAPAVDFKINLTSEHQTFTTYTGNAPLAVQFIDWSTGDPTSWAWDFNNDGSTDSTLERPVYTYTSPGTYSVKLTATNSAGSNSVTKTGCIVVTGTTPTISIVATGGITNWPFSMGTNEDLTSVDLSVTTTASNWHVSVKDALDGGKPAGTAGKMAEYTGSAYPAGGKFLTNALQVKSGTGSYVTLSGSDLTVQTGTTPGTFNYDIGLKQVIAVGDPALTAPNVYRVVITFTASTD